MFDEHTFILDPSEIEISYKARKEPCRLLSGRTRF